MFKDQNYFNWIIEEYRIPILVFIENTPLEKLYCTIVVVFKYKL